MHSSSLRHFQSIHVAVAARAETGLFELVLPARPSEIIVPSLQCWLACYLPDFPLSFLSPCPLGVELCLYFEQLDPGGLGGSL